MRVTIDISKSDPKDSWKTLIENVSELPIYEEIVHKANIKKLISYIESLLEGDDYSVIKVVINLAVIYFVYRNGVVVMTPECPITDNMWDYIKTLREDVVEREKIQKEKED